MPSTEERSSHGVGLWLAVFSVTGAATVGWLIAAASVSHFPLWPAFVFAAVAFLCLVGAIRQWPFPFARRPAPPEPPRIIPGDVPDAPIVNMDAFNQYRAIGKALLENPPDPPVNGEEKAD